MAGITLSQAKSRLSAVQSAIDAILNKGSSSYSIGDRSFSALDIGQLLEMETHYDKMVKRLSRGGIRISGATPSC